MVIASAHSPSEAASSTPIRQPAGSPKFDILAVDPNLGPLGAYGGPTLGAIVVHAATRPACAERLLPGSPALDKVPSGPTGSCADTGGTPLTTAQLGAGFVRPFLAGGNCDIGAFEASILTFGNLFGAGTGSCSAAITFFSGGTAFALRTGEVPAPQCPAVCHRGTHRSGACSSRSQPRLAPATAVAGPVVIPFPLPHSQTCPWG